MVAPRPPRFRAVGQGSFSSDGTSLASDCDSGNWITRFAPESTELVAMHRRKREDIASAISDIDTKILVISGPPGSSKTTAVRAICQDLQREISEWMPPGSATGTGLVDAFGDYCVGAALLPCDTVILIDEPPNLTHTETRIAFHQTLHWWVGHALPLMVLILNSNSSSELRPNRLLSDLLPNPRVKHIVTGKVNATEIKRALNRIFDMSKPTISSNADPKSVISTLSEEGDIRYAINSFELWCRYGGDSVPDSRDGEVTIFQVLHVILGGISDFSRVEEYLKSIPEDWRQLNLHLLESYSTRLALDGCVDASDWLSLADLRSASVYDSYFPACLGGFGVSKEISVRPLQRAQNSKLLNFAKFGEQEKKRYDFAESLKILQADAMADGFSLTCEDAMLQYSLFGLGGAPLEDMMLDFSDSSDDNW